MNTGTDETNENIYKETHKLIETQTVQHTRLDKLKKPNYHPVISILPRSKKLTSAYNFQ
jgi:hypothetical protein